MKYVLLVFSSVLLTAIVISLDFYYVVGKALLNEVGDANFMAILKDASLLLGLHLSIYLVIVILVSVFVSHKFAGPIFRLERVSEAVAKGDLTVRAFFRKGDELFETAEYINQMVDSLRKKIGNEKTLSHRIAEELKEVSGKLQKGDITQKEAANQLRDLIVEVEHITSNFKL